MILRMVTSFLAAAMLAAAAASVVAQTNAPNVPGTAFPPGPWRNSCRDAGMDGPYLRARCPDRNGQLQSEIFDTRECRGAPIINDNGQLRCQVASVDPRAQPQPQVQPQPRSSDGFPSGPWRDTCRNPKFEANGILMTDCLNATGRWRTNRIDLRSCPNGPLGNDDGRIVCMGGGGAIPPAGPNPFAGMPGGSWQATCRQPSYHSGGLLEAQCLDRNGRFNNASIMIGNCPSRRARVNDEGNLRCE